MYEKPLLIVGIDPGTTIGYAILDLSGRQIESSSMKDLDLPKLISLIIEVGKPVIVGTDKAKVPDLIERFATKTGARIVSPEEDLLVKHKRELAEEFRFNKTHEMDALAAAAFAFKRKRSLIKKIDSFVVTYKKDRIRNKIAELVLKNEELSIKHACELIEKPNEEERIVVKALEEDRIDKKDYLKLYTELRRLRKDHMLLREVFEKAKAENKSMKDKLGYLQNKISGLSSDHHLRIKVAQKEERLQNVYHHMNTKQEHINDLNRKINHMYGMLSQIDDKVVAKKLSNLGWAEIERKKDILKLKKGDIILVDDPNEYSDRTLEFLKGLIEILIVKKKPSKAIAATTSMVFIDANKLKINEDTHFATIDKDDLERARGELDLLSKIIDDYRKERNPNL